MAIDSSRMVLPSIPFILLLLIFIVFDILLVRQYRRQKALDARIQLHGVEVTGFVTKRYQTLMSNYIIYTYKHQEQNYTQIQSVTPEDYSKISEGASLKVYCLPENARNSLAIEFKVYYLFYRLAFGCSFLTIAYGVLLILSVIAGVIALFTPLP